MNARQADGCATKGEIDHIKAITTILKQGVEQKKGKVVKAHNVIKVIANIYKEGTLNYTYNNHIYN